MLKTILKIDGMACSMCEAHINDVIRKQFDVKKVTSSCKKNQAEILSETVLDENRLRAAIEDTGYTVLEIRTEPYAKKRLFHRG